MAVTTKKVTTEKDYSMDNARKQASELIKDKFSPKSTAGTLRDRGKMMEDYMKKNGY
jgi:hypothetical protein